MEIITPLNNKVSMFDDKLTDKEIITIKLAKIEEFADDLYRSTQSNYHAELFPADQCWFKIKELLKELNQLNCE
tara:strand:- start:1216 stop:1437 length:222 start_codon:yes stop_codon:yes gene_type:complete